ncbi:NUDIX domain-containing protein [Paracoccus onubensis]|uniref:NUDIX domain-containing protein n=1 Tax=Paracoccus onubensis TaxID=1675788 RepID=UPI00272F09F3|nr:NUDIX domain-containing protein [Paracoccus onubensis]MDP0927043.1 NUDIX domain-containing protein [Paracoccus onubensis]
MNRDVLLVGPLAHAAICDVLGVSGEKVMISGRLLGGKHAGIKTGDWPRFTDAELPLEARRVVMTPELARYAAVMGLHEFAHKRGVLLGVLPRHDVQQEEWSEAGWQPMLAAEIARLILDEPENMQPAQIAGRLPMIGVWAESRLRAAAALASGGDVVAAHDPSDIRLHERQQPFAGFFAVEEWRLSHRKFDGSFTPQIRREGFVMGDAVVVLPWDPVRDRVLVIEQFRLGPAMRHDPQPWMLEAIAGRIDAGETVEEAARREAEEEAGLRLQHLFPAVHCYPSPGAITEFLYQFIGIADLPDGVAGVHGLTDEAEDIRGHLLSRGELARMLHDGEITNGPLSMLILWLEGQASRILSDLDAGQG